VSVVALRRRTVAGAVGVAIGVTAAVVGSAAGLPVPRPPWSGAPAPAADGPQGRAPAAPRDIPVPPPAPPSPGPTPTPTPAPTQEPPSPPVDPPARLVRPSTPTDPSQRLVALGLMWMRPLATRASRAGDSAALTALVDEAVAFHAAHPDPGTPTAGWDEGTALRRLEVLNQLFAATADRRLPALMARNVAVLLSDRYYGPPRYAVHNHGVMANLRVLRAGELLDRPHWKRRALARMVAEAPFAFSAQGTSLEQSSQYHQVNVDLWNQAAAQLERAGDPASVAAARAIRATTARGAAVGRWLTEPDGDVVQIGNADRARGPRRAGSPDPGTGPAVFQDDEAGLAVGRWSWTDRATTYYTLRYGPPIRAHGQQDRGGVTWSTSGARILVNPGRFGYEKATAYEAWQSSARSHNVATPADGAPPARRVDVRVEARALTACTHSYTTSDQEYGRPHLRHVVVDDCLRSLTVQDAYGGTGRAGDVVQHWHLDPAWVLRGKPRRMPGGGTAATFTDRSGRTLTVASTGRIAGVVSGSRAPYAGWWFPSAGRAVPAPEITVLGGSPVRTTFTLG